MSHGHLLRRGQVYWLDNCAPLDDDNAKRRPVVVVHVAASDPALVVAVTTQHRSNEPDLIALPNQADHPRATSGLPRRCWAVPRWLLPVEQDALTELAGYVSGAVLRRLLAAVKDRISRS
jgi:mRNA-degrading endonuclease toxin of MazEF toxin-antitoxin module